MLCLPHSHGDQISDHFWRIVTIKQGLLIWFVWPNRTAQQAFAQNKIKQFRSDITAVRTIAVGYWTLQKNPTIVDFNFFVLNAKKRTGSDNNDNSEDKLNGLVHRGRLILSFAIRTPPPLRVNSCADLFVPDPPIRVYGTHPHTSAHVKNPTSICRKRVGPTAGDKKNTAYIRG